MENAEAKGTQDTYFTRHLCSLILQLKTTFVYKFIVRKYFFEIIELFQTYQKL